MAGHARTWPAVLVDQKCEYSVPASAAPGFLLCEPAFTDTAFRASNRNLILRHLNAFFETQLLSVSRNLQDRHAELGTVTTSVTLHMPLARWSPTTTISWPNAHSSGPPPLQWPFSNPAGSGVAFWDLGGSPEPENPHTKIFYADFLVPRTRKRLQKT